MIGLEYGEEISLLFCLLALTLFATVAGIARS